MPFPIPHRLSAPHNRTVVAKLIRYTVVMFTFPIGVFFISQHLVFGSDKDYLGHSGIAAVVAANLVIASYVRMAWYEDKPASGLGPDSGSGALKDPLDAPKTD